MIRETVPELISNIHSCQFSSPSAMVSVYFLLSRSSVLKILSHRPGAKTNPDQRIVGYFLLSRIQTTAIQLRMKGNDLPTMGMGRLLSRGHIFRLSANFVVFKYARGKAAPATKRVTHLGDYKALWSGSLFTSGRKRTVSATWLYIGTKSHSSKSRTVLSFVSQCRNPENALQPAMIFLVC